jgi:hypothetical protein
VLETDGARDFSPTENTKYFTVMIAGSEVIKRCGQMMNNQPNQKSYTPQEAPCSICGSQNFVWGRTVGESSSQASPCQNGKIVR